MDENNSVQNTDVQDTIPENNQETQTDIELVEDTSVIPNRENPTEENVMRDTDYETAQKSVSENPKYRSLLFRYSIITKTEILQKRKL